MPRGKKRPLPEVSSGSMADIAFLLLIFFLVTTTIANDKGIAMLLPPKPDPNEPPPEVNKNDKNIFKILANSSDQLLVEDEPYKKSMDELKKEVKEFVLNFGDPTEEGIQVYNSLPSSMKASVNRFGKRPDSSDDPTECVVSFKAARGTSYELYIDVLDAINAAYNEIYAERVGITVEEWLALDKDDDIQKDMYNRARSNIPRAISIAEPD
ncbi:ExbD/TolR family protein [Marinoscillum furvescens]|uniref:Biopolymer transport protein ExbD n=1 Tax=Marinoscillum furvescens DSM 4134 TaxID=1122208 RepID=A0A3D9LH48_MARFU|nr:biopolymer transporter ExbD [Marinoscillum furvescens]REE05721.1 biopolymer transport protein ExbD [Marinoscillum furvescens DSM 4134]